MSHHSKNLHCDHRAKNVKKRFFLPIMPGLLLCIAILLTIAARVTIENAVFAQSGIKSISGSNPELASQNDDLAKTTAEEQQKSRKLIREGTLLRSQKVMFRITESRSLMVLVDGQERFICLENLNLERIAKVIHENPTQTDWEVDFIVTEYQGANYALIQKAILSTRVRK